MRAIFFYSLCILLVFSNCSKNNHLFVVKDQNSTNISFSNTLENKPDLNILNYLYYYNGAGVVAADFNNDGFIDIFFTGNQVQDELYLNKGDFVFENITKKAGLTGVTSWSTGATHVDINSDGLLDLYICKVSGHNDLKGKNLLYINQGVDTDGVPQFKESAETYGLDFSGLSTHASFFDYDLDGDLDLYLLNHSVYPNRNYGHGNLRKGYDALAGDVLFENKEGVFIDRTEFAKIFQGRIGYGLGLSVADINNDGYPDLYVGNDFFENDYLYINQQDGTFHEILSTEADKLGHTTHFSMGNTIADINNDGLVDIISMDMLPENLQTYKSSGLEYGYPIYRQYLNKGYAPQYMQNTLHLNLDGSRLSEIANISGISATEWSWGSLAADFDNDGHKDLFVSNGILGATNDMDYMSFIASEAIQKRIDQGMNDADMPLVQEIPEKKVANYFFHNKGDLTFKDVTSEWMNEKPSFSNGTVYADLDNDGDLDIIVNNINDVATVLENTSQLNNYLQITFKGPKKNRFGIGTKAVLFCSGKQQVKENFPVTGYLSAVAPEVHFGLGTDTIIDSLKIYWPDGKMERLTNLKGNSKILVDYSTAYLGTSISDMAAKGFTINKNPLSFKHEENISLDFDREPLIPFAYSNEGPTIAVGDSNNDGLEDVFITGAKKQSDRLYEQTTEGQFKISDTSFEEFSGREGTASLFFDANGDGLQDLIVAYGGNEFGSGPNIRPQLFLNLDGTLKAVEAFAIDIEGHISSINTGDLNNDGHLDLVMTSGSIPGSFGKTPRNYVLLNDGKGYFREATSTFAPDFQFLGNLMDAKITDINDDGHLDIVAVGHWTPISIFLGNGTALQLQTENGLHDKKGLWNTVSIADMDNDGDLDILCGNWGLNSKLQASTKEPLALYRYDFDANGTVESVMTYFHKGVETPFASKDELTKQLPFLNKRFLSYAAFATASLDDLFGNEVLEKARLKEVNTLRTSYFENIGDEHYLERELPLLAQSSQVRDITVDDFNADGALDILLTGNNFHISTQLGRLDALHGLVLYNDGSGNFVDNFEHLEIDGQVNAIAPLKIADKEGYLIGRNDDQPIFLIKKDTL